MEGGGEGTSANKAHGWRNRLSVAAITVDGGVAVGFRLCFMARSVKNKIGSEFRVSVRVHSVLGCPGSCGEQS